VLAERWPGVPIYDDVRDVGRVQSHDSGHGAHASSGRGRVRPVDFLCGGFPCQDLSVAGQRRGLQAGERSSLFFEFARVADELVPAGGYVLVENVPGLLSSQNGRDFALVLATLAELGFHDLAWRVLDSRHFGVPQRRRRVFILARRCAAGRRAFEVLLEPESGGGDSAASGEAGAGVAFASLSGLGSGGPDDNDGQAGRVIAVSSVTGSEYTAGLPTLDKGAEDGPRRNQDAPIIVVDTLTSGSHPGSNMPGRRREDDTNIVTAFHQTQDPISGPISPALGVTSGGMGVAFSENQRGEVLETTYAHQLTSGGGKPGQGYAAAMTAAGVRRLTPIECERLQGLPDDWTRVPDTAPDSRRYAGLGDAVTSPVAEWIGQRLLKAEA
jgi:DNA (cytosine-5)-methyltransferase 1